MKTKKQKGSKKYLVIAFATIMYFGVSVAGVVWGHIPLVDLTYSALPDILAIWLTLYLYHESVKDEVITQQDIQDILTYLKNMIGAESDDVRWS